MPGFRHGCHGSDSGPQACTANPHPPTTRNAFPLVCSSRQNFCSSLTKPYLFCPPFSPGSSAITEPNILGSHSRGLRSYQRREKHHLSVNFLSYLLHLPSKCIVQLWSCCHQPFLTFHRCGNFCKHPTLEPSRNSYYTGTLHRKHTQVTCPRSHTKAPKLTLDTGFSTLPAS